MVFLGSRKSRFSTLFANYILLDLNTLKRLAFTSSRCYLFLACFSLRSLNLKEIQPTKKPLRFYESVVLTASESTESEQKEIFKKSDKIIKDFKGELDHIETWGDRSLKNHIGSAETAKYFYILFKAEGDCIKELERNYRINDKVLRFFHLNLDSRVSLSKHLETFHEVIKNAQLALENDQLRFAARKNKNFSRRDDARRDDTKRDDTRKRDDSENSK